jgi:hypothetical protein
MALPFLKRWTSSETENGILTLKGLTNFIFIGIRDSASFGHKKGRLSQRMKAATAVDVINESYCPLPIN